MKLRTAIHLVLSAAALGGSIPAQADVAAEAEDVTILEEIVVTAQKREENAQDVPIAVTALTPEAMALQRIDIGADLQRVVPNLYFSRLAGGETNFQIRGIGYQLVATAGDAGVGLHSNNIPLSVTRIADAEFFDLERIEVLRGPQGTLYGRNATGGVINMITAKPTTDAVSARLNVEFGDYETRKLNGYVNVPLGTAAAIRIAGVALQRDGYTKNVLSEGASVDGRDLWSGRATFLFNPVDAFKVTLRWEHFEEDDDRNGGAKQLCIKDPGPTSVGGVVTNLATQNYLSRGCLSGSIYSDAAYGSVNYVAALAGQLGNLSGLFSGDIYAGVEQSRDLRETALTRGPSYEVTNDLYELNLEFMLGNNLKLTSLTGYAEDTFLSQGAVASYVTNVTFNNVAGLAPGGVYNDPQNGASNHPQVLTIQNNESEQLSTELRLQSSFSGPLNFNIGGIYLNLKKTNDLFIAPNTQNAFVELANLLNNTPPSPFSSCASADCYFDASAFPDGTGHNYFVSHVPYELTAMAGFGELYWDVVDTLRLTTGLRYTDDKKEILLHPSNMLTPGRGYTPNVPIAQEASWQEVTGRANLDWHPTDDNLVYISYSKGYKGGGINNPDANTTSPAYDPEFVNAYEIGSKNRLFGGSLIVNATGFYYDYEGYQISQRRGLIAATENIDATVKGAELEMLWEPVADLRFNAVAGWLNTEIKSGSSIDTFDRIQGQSGVTLVKATTDTCLVSTPALANFINYINNGTPVIPVAGGGSRAPRPSDLLGICSGALNAFGFAPSAGNPADLTGKELPQSPEFTASFGAEYTFGIGGQWNLTVRGDYYYQTESFMRVYNTENDELRAWNNVGASLLFANRDLGVSVQLYGKNLQDEDVITGYLHNSDQLGLTRDVTLLDPRLFGAVVSWQF